MNVQHHGHEHEFEAQYGLPERLPAGERILWQGAPDAMALAIRAFHVRKLALYFAALLALRAATLHAAVPELLGTLRGLLLPALLSAMALAAMGALAWLSARTTVYTLTDRRLVLRVGIVLTLTFNVPLRSIAAADLRVAAGGCGDLPLRLAGDDRIAWLHLWPHVRPWRVARPEPMLRCVPQAQAVSAMLAQAWSAATGVAVPPPAAPAPSAAAPQHWQPSPT